MLMTSFKAGRGGLAEGVYRIQGEKKRRTCLCLYSRDF